MSSIGTSKPAPTSPLLCADDLLDRLDLAIARKKEAEAEIGEIKACFSQMKKDGVIGNELQHPNFNLVWQTRSTWKYSPAVKQLQDEEKFENIALETITGAWYAKPNRSN